LQRQVCFRYADRNRVIPAYLLARSLEEVVRSAIRPTAVGPFVSVSEEAIRPAIEELRRIVDASMPNSRAVVLTSMDVRRHVRTLLTRNDLDLAVLSYQELAPEFSIQTLATITGELMIDDGQSEKTQIALETLN
jgi:type III secretion protein V